MRSPSLHALSPAFSPRSNKASRSATDPAALIGDALDVAKKSVVVLQQDLPKREWSAARQNPSKTYSTPRLAGEAILNLVEMRSGVVGGSPSGGGRLSLVGWVVV